MEILICPGCRTRTADRLDLRTLDRAGELLACTCGRTYPIVDGVPIVLADPTTYFANEIATVVERDLAPEVSALLVAGGPDDAPYPRLLEHLSIYMDAHWGDRASPAPGGPGAHPEDELLAKVRALPRVALAIELGCSVGRGVAELARNADHVVGLDLHHGALRRARRLLAGEPVSYARRMIGRHYHRATASAGELAIAGGDRITWICGDALDPPLVPGVYDRVVALNLLDSVANPQQLIAVLDGLCAPGGELVLASPYSWHSSVVVEGHRIGTDDPGRELVSMLGAYQIEDEANLPWMLRRDARSATTYCIHYLRCRKV